MGQNDLLAFLSSHREEISRRFHVTTLGIFGSFARDESTDQSDVDILYDFDSDVESVIETKQAFREYLESELHRSVDLCHRKYLKPFVRKIIEKEALFV